MEKFIKNLVKDAGNILLEGYKKKDVKANLKGKRWNVVTEYDLKAEKFLIEKVKDSYPNYDILSEESQQVVDDKYLWIFDPLDGTRNFSRKIPIFGTVAAYVEDGEVIMGAMYLPLIDELYYAKKGKGAFLNGEKIQVNEETEFRNSLVSLEAVEGNIDEVWDDKIRDMCKKHKLWNDEKIIGGPISFCWVAAGRYDISACMGSYPWDLAAGSLIASEAGAKVTDHEGNGYNWKSKSLVVANPVLHKKFMKELNG